MNATGFQFDAEGPWIVKDPDAVLNYAVDWGVPLSNWLNGASIASVAWTVPAGLALAGQSETATVATVVLSGGTAGEVYTVTCRITTNGTPALTDDRSFRVVVRER